MFDCSITVGFAKPVAGLHGLSAARQQQVLIGGAKRGETMRTP